MQRFRNTFTALVVVTSFTLPLAPQASSPLEAAPAAANFIAGEVLVKFKPGTPGQLKAAAHRQNGGQTKEVLAGIDVEVIGVPGGQEADRVAAYNRDPNVLFAEVNVRYQATGAPNDPKAGQQWQYNNTGQTGGKSGADIQAFAAWDITMGSASAPIAILDTGIDQSHEDLASKIAKQVNFTTSSTANDRYGHGTHVAGSAAAITDNSVGVSGTCPKCSLYNIKVLDDTGSGYTSWIANGIIWAADNGAKVITMSLGGTSGSSTMQSAVNYAWNKGAVLVAAAGNDGSSQPQYPAYYGNVISVAAVDMNDARASFSNYGSWVNVAAPGTAILSTAPDHSNTIWGSGVKYGTLSGTSMAAPHVAGVAGLVWSSGVCAANDNGCVRTRIQDGADRIAGSGTYWTSGRINAYKSVASAPSNSAPAVSLVDPAAGQTIKGTYIVTAVASDSDGSVTKVELGIDGAFTDITAGRDAGDPATYRYSWNTSSIPDGPHRLDARVTDNGGAVGAAAAVTINVENAVANDTPPTSDIVAPANGSAVQGTVTIQVNAADDQGIAAVEYAIDGAAYAAMSYNSSSGSWEAPWNTTGVTDGSHTLDARARDTAGQTGQASRFTVTVANATKALTVTAATDKSAYSRSESVYITLAVADNTAQPVASASLRVDIYAPSGRLYAVGTSSTGSSGSVTFQLRLPSTAPRGAYRIVGTASKSGYASGQASTAFSVR